MIIAHYEHRLPACYDLDMVRRRAVERGNVWNSVPDLFFKAFVLREAGRFGAASNSYSSFYLWRADEAYRNWLVQGGYQVVINSFGRANIETMVALDAFRGPAEQARFLYRNDILLSPDADLTDGISREIDLARAQARLSGTVAAVVGLDTQQWKFIRVRLSADEPSEPSDGVAHQIGLLSRPMLEQIPRGYPDIRPGNVRAAPQEDARPEQAARSE